MILSALAATVRIDLGSLLLSPMTFTLTPLSASSSAFSLKNSSISRNKPWTSEIGLFQFSVENANKVTYPIPPCRVRQERCP